MNIKIKVIKTVQIIGVVFLLIVPTLTRTTSANIIQIRSSSPPGLPDFYVNDDWEGIENGTVVIDYIIDYIIGDNAFAKIQDALDKAYSYDKIFVFQGTYNENLIIRENRDYVDIRGIYGWEDPDPMGENLIIGFTGEPVILIESLYVRIYGFIITNNGAESDGVVDKGIYNEIFENTIKNIGGTGVVLTSDSFGCQVYHNNFINNGQNALDNSKKTERGFSVWYKDYEGNYWDDHPGGVKRNKKVWLKPYDIPGSANSRDIYPWIYIDGKIKSKSVNLFLCLLEKKLFFKSHFF